MRRFVITTAAVMAAVFLFLLLTLPPRPASTAGAVDEGVRRRTVAGAFHVHSTRSDGAADVDRIAEAASRAGLAFVILTDHGDATRVPDPPSYRHGVLTIDAVEISTNGGHYVALDMSAAPYPLGGEAWTVVEDVRRLGGFGIAAHPDSAKPELRWADASGPIDGFEWLNLDSEWRDESRASLALLAMRYALRPAPAIASMIDVPSASMRRWERAMDAGPVVGVAAHDAHGGVREQSGRSWLAIPSYEASFRTFAIRALLESPSTGDAAADARLVLDAVRKGRVFTAIDAAAAPAFVDYRVSAGGRELLMGDTAPFEGPAQATVRTMVPAGGRIAIVRSGEVVASGSGPELSVSLDRPGAYRVEIAAPGVAAPWVVTNPIYLRSAGAPATPAPAFDPAVSIPLAGAVVEKDSVGSTAELSLQEGFALGYRLRPGQRASQFVAAAIALPEGAGEADAISLSARASAPMRVSVQLRFNALAGARWVSSVYLSPEDRRVSVPFDRLLPADLASSHPPFTAASSILFVVDLTNASPGSEGRFEIRDLSFSRIRR